MAEKTGLEPQLGSVVPPLSEHTPGPWKADIRTGIAVVYHDDENNCLMGDEDNVICAWHGERVVGDDDLPRWRMDEEDIANARLIAAAPELLEALEALLKSLPGTRYYYRPKITRAALDAIARATGEGE